MSRLASLLLVVASATAFADTAEPPKAEETTATTAAPAAKSSKFPLRVVKVLPESEQALLFDKGRHRHVLVEVGETVGDYTVTGIDGDEVTLTGVDMPVEVVLAAPESKKAKKSAPKKVAEATTEAPEDPYADAAPAKKAPKAPADPYADDEIVEGIAGALEDSRPVKAKSWSATTAEGEKSTTSPFANMDANAAKPSEDVANAGIPKAKATPKPAVDDEPAAKHAKKAPVEDDAPVDALDDEAPARPAPPKHAPKAKASVEDDTPADALDDEVPAKPAAKHAPKAKAPVEDDAPALVDEAPAKPATPTIKADAPTKLARKEVNGALNDFGALSKSIDGAFGAQGLTLEKVAPGSVFAKAGLQVGDVVTAVDGKPLRTIDDAADLYARAGSMKSASVAIVRAGKPQTLRVVIQ